MMKKHKSAIVLFLALFCFSIIFIIYRKNNVDVIENDDKKNHEISIIRSSKVYLPFDEAVLDSELVVKVEVVGKNSELGSDMENGIPKTVHDVKILDIYNGDLVSGDNIKVIQDGIESILVDGVPIFQPGDTFIFMLDVAELTNGISNTYFIKKEYFMSKTSSQAIDLNFGDSNFKDLGSSKDNVLNKKVDAISENIFVDKESISIIDANELINSIKEVVESEKK